MHTRTFVHAEIYFVTFIKQQFFLFSLFGSPIKVYRSLCCDSLWLAGDELGVGERSTVAVVSSFGVVIVAGWKGLNSSWKIFYSQSYRFSLEYLHDKTLRRGTYWSHRAFCTDLTFVDTDHCSSNPDLYNMGARSQQTHPQDRWHSSHHSTLPGRNHPAFCGTPWTVAGSVWNKIQN